MEEKAGDEVGRDAVNKNRVEYQHNAVLFAKNRKKIKNQKVFVEGNKYKSAFHKT